MSAGEAATRSARDMSARTVGGRSSMLVPPLDCDTARACPPPGDAVDGGHNRAVVARENAHQDDGGVGRFCLHDVQNRLNPLGDVQHPGFIPFRDRSIMLLQRQA